MTRRWWRTDIPLRPLRTRWRRSKMCACFHCQGFGCGLPAAGGACVLKTGHDGGCVFYT